MLKIRAVLPLRACLALVLALGLGGCHLGGPLLAMTQSTARFTTCTPDARILCEPGSEALAARIAAELPAALGSIEKAQFARFAAPVRVLTYASADSFSTHSSASPGAAGVVIFGAAHISPVALRHADGVAKILAHELSHLQLAQQLGALSMSCLPAWFSEGLATWASNGGAAGQAYEPNVLVGIRHGQHFEPVEAQSLWKPYLVLPRRMAFPTYYSQTRLFVAFMHERDPDAFRVLLARLGRRDSFGDAVRAAYGRPVAGLWQEFVASIG